MAPNFLASFASQLGTRAAGRVADKVFGFPKPIVGAAAGAQDRAYDQARFPGLNPWELSGNASGSAPGNVAGIGSATQRRGQDSTAGIMAAERENKKDINKAQIKSNEKIAAASLLLKRDQFSEVEKPIAGHKGRLMETQINLLNADKKLRIQQELTELRRTKLIGNQSSLEGSKAALKEVEARWPNLYHWMKIAAQGSQTVGTIVGTFNIGRVANRIGNALSRGNGPRGISGNSGGNRQKFSFRQHKANRAGKR